VIIEEIIARSLPLRWQKVANNMRFVRLRCLDIEGLCTQLETPESPSVLIYVIAIAMGFGMAFPDRTAYKPVCRR
jgi:hypothetical protein